MRKRSGVPSGKLSDARRLGSADARWYTSQGEKVVVFRRRSIALQTVDAAHGGAINITERSEGTMA